MRDLFYTYVIFLQSLQNSTSLAVNEQSYFIQLAHRQVTFVGVFDTRFNLLMRPFFKRLEDFYGGQVVNTYRNSCYHSCAHGQSLLCLQQRADEG